MKALYNSTFFYLSYLNSLDGDKIDNPRDVMNMAESLGITPLGDCDVVVPKEEPMECTYSEVISTPPILRRKFKRKVDMNAVRKVSYLSLFTHKDDYYLLQSYGSVNDMSFEMSSTSTPLFPTAQSTPVTTKRGASVLTTPNNSFDDHNTPRFNKYSPTRSHHRLSEAPRTPTPFKKALADVYLRREPLSNTVIKTFDN